jgi:hypothetical protein
MASKPQTPDSPDAYKDYGPHTAHVWGLVQARFRPKQRIPDHPKTSKRIHRLLSHQTSLESLGMHLMCLLQDPSMRWIFLDTLHRYPKLYILDVNEPFTLIKVEEAPRQSMT